MSIFKETFRDFVFEQLRIREAIMKKGNAGDSRFTSIEDFSPRTEIKGKDGKTKKITIDAGAFYTNTTSKQCVIRMCSGVDIKDDEETIKSILEDTQFEKARDLTGAGLAIRYILESGVPAKNIDFTKNISKEEGKKEYGRDFSQGVGVIPRGRGNRGFGKNYGSTYGDPYLRSDAADGFGIVPMPGIVDADIRTKTAYGSLREAKINFICHNRRQLEVLELLYMRPGYPVLLEWGWDPFINNEGKRESYFPYINEWFEEGSDINQIDAEIVRRKKVTGGNYDGFVGFIKNFEITSRNDGGYNCSTELVAMGEALDGLKGRRSGLELYDFESKEFIEVDDLEFILETLNDLSEFKTDPNESNGSLRGENFQNLQNLLYSSKIISSKPVPVDLNGGFTEDEIKSNEGEVIRKESHLNPKRTDTYKIENGKVLIKVNDGGEYKFFPIDDPVVTNNNFINYKQNKSRSIELKTALSDFFIFKDDPIVNLLEFENTEVSSKSGFTYVRWDFMVNLLNKIVIDQYKTTEEKNEPITEFTFLRDPISKENIKPQYLEYATFSFGELEANNLTTTTSNSTKIKIEDLIDMSVDPSICFLPHQIKPKLKEILSKTQGITEKSIGLVYLNLTHLLKTFKSMRYNEDGTNDDFSIIDYIKKIWEQDVNNACAGTHNFMLQTEHERPNVLRIIDVTFQSPDLQPENLFEFKIQSNEAIVRDFNFNTTIPSALSSTIAIAAQSPTSVSDLDQVTFSKFNQHTKYRFFIDDETPTPDPKKQQEKDSKVAKRLDKEISQFNENINKLYKYRNSMLLGKNVDDADGSSELISLNRAKGFIKGIEQKIISIKNKYLKDITIEGVKYKKGYPKVKNSTSKSAVIPLKFNAQMDGISGIVMGNVFKVEKNKLPKGYQADDIAFVVMNESQKITSGQDWTTEINGQLVLLDLPEQTGGTENTTGQTGTSTNTTTTSAETSTQETSTEEKNQLDEADKTVGNTGLTQEEIDAGKLETTNRKVNGHKPYEYAYLIQAAQVPSNGAIKEEFFKGNTAKVNKINELIDFLKENYASDFQYNFNLNDFPKLNNQNVGSAYPSYELWIQAFIQYFPEFRAFTTDGVTIS
jgi:hypothetical protein